MRRRLDPAYLFDALAVTHRRLPGAGHLGGFFEVVGRPGERLLQELEAGDLVVRRALGEGGLAHLRPLTAADLEVRRGTVLLPFDQLVLRPRLPAARPPAVAGELGEQAAAPDSPAADRFVAAHRSRYCTPGQAGSATCATLVAPRTVRRVVIHVVAVPTTSRRTGVEAVVAAWQRSGRQASAHYLVDRDGTVTQMVREADAAFHTPGHNRDTIGIEHADVCNDPAPLTDALYERSAALVRDLASRHGFTVSPVTVAGHRQVAGNHADPGPYWDWEFYFLLIAWNGTSAARRPRRYVAAAAQAARPAGWQLGRRRAIPNSRCATRRDPWGATYWRASPSAAGAAAELSVVVDEPGDYKVSLWWPDVRRANPATPVDIEVRCLQSPCRGTSAQSLAVNQRPGSGRWNDLAVVTVSAPPSEVLVRIRRDSASPGWILADALRVLKVRPSPAAAGGGASSGGDLDADFAGAGEQVAAAPPAGASGLARRDLSVLCPPPPTVLDRFAYNSNGLTAAHRAALGALAQTVAASQGTARPVHTLCLVGHTDSTGAAASNVGLGERRARAVETELRRQLDALQPGLAARLDLRVSSQGEASPAASNSTPTGRAQNRRVEVFSNHSWITSCHRSPVSANDPTALDLHAVGEHDYDAGTVTVFGRALRLRGSVFYPAATAGRDRDFAAGLGEVPVVFLLHGNHATFRNPADRFDEDCSNPGGFVPIPNHAGYAYLQRLLARMGIVSVSVDCNQTNCTGPTASNINLRAGLLRETLRHFLGLHRGGDRLFGGHLDFSRLGLFGHSRGGEAVLRAAETLGASADFTGVGVRGVLSLAPTDLGSLAGRPSGFDFLAVLPAADGDVVTNDGARHYDQTAPGRFKSQLYVHGAFHNFFNREWPQNDGLGPALLSRADHERLLSVYGTAFFRHVLLGHATAGFLRGDELPPATPVATVHLSFEERTALTVDDHEDGNVALNTLGRATAQSGGLTAAELPFIFGDPLAFNNTFFHRTVGLVARTVSPGGQFRSELAAATDLTDREVWIRAAEVYDGASVPPAATGYLIGVEDAAGRIAFADSSHAGGLPRPYDRRAQDVAAGIPDFTKTMLNTLRFPAGCFVGLGVDVTRIRALVLRLDRTPGRALAFDQLQIV